MSENSKIEWCDHTFNIAWGCTESSPGCDNCYARVLAKRYGYGWGPGAERRVLSEAYWREPLKWNARAAAANKRERVFCSSMTDVFLNDPIINSQRDRLYTLIDQTPHLDWLLLTKHAERLSFLAPVDDDCKPARNVWLGVSVESNDYAWRADRLLKAPATIRFLSVEPMLGPVDKVPLAGIDWVICGGESGPRARSMDVDWARDLRDRCDSLGVAFFLKQLGGVRDKRGGTAAVLDGCEYKAYPKVIVAA
jgi:protein gp37